MTWDEIEVWWSKKEETSSAKDMQTANDPIQYDDDGRQRNLCLKKDRLPVHKKQGPHRSVVR